MIWGFFPIQNRPKRMELGPSYVQITIFFWEVTCFKLTVMSVCKKHSKTIKINWILHFWGSDDLGNDPRIFPCKHIPKKMKLRPSFAQTTTKQNVKLRPSIFIFNFCWELRPQTHAAGIARESHRSFAKSKNHSGGVGLKVLFTTQPTAQSSSRVFRPANKKNCKQLKSYYSTPRSVFWILQKKCCGGLTDLFPSVFDENWCTGCFKQASNPFPVSKRPNSDFVCINSVSYTHLTLPTNREV